MNPHRNAVALSIALFCLALYGCGGLRPTPTSDGTSTAPGQPTPTAVVGSSPNSSAAPVPETAAPTTSATSAESPTPEPLDTGGSTTGGDIPDNAVFLTYPDATHGFSIQYVEGWQVTPNTDGVAIRDKDSSETVQTVPAVTDIAAYIAAADLPQLQTLTGFTLDTQDTVSVGGVKLDHLVYHAPSPPDPVTGKQVASTIDRYYVPGTTGLAIVTLSTPDGVDNVDAFRQMIKSFTWA